MSLTVRRPVPIYRMLLLENKILLFFTMGMLFSSTVVLFAVYWTTDRMTSDSLLDRAETVVQTQIQTISQAAAGGDQETLMDLLAYLLQLDSSIAYLAISDAQQQPIIAQVNSTVAVTLPNAGLVEDVSLPAWDADDYHETTVLLTHQGKDVGLLRIGVRKHTSANIARRATGMVFLFVIMPWVVLVGVGRVMVRRAVTPLKELTKVADEISAGNLEPRIDFGIHVNCWEIMNCGKTDCHGYMNYTEQCWYIDDTPCEGYEPRFPQKLRHCHTCEVYKAHRGDEVVQLADSFRHMTNVLKASRQALTDSDDFQKRLIQNSFDGIVATNEQDVITIFNDVAERLIGQPREEVVGSKQWRAFFPDGLEKTMDLPLSFEPVRRLRGFAPKESAVRRASGELIAVQLAGISLYDRGRHIGKVFFFQDMREVKTLRESLLQSERLAAAGQAAAGISHSIKNILDGFNGGVFVYKMGQRRGDEEKVKTGWDMIERNVKIISDLVTDLLNFAKERIPEYQEHDPYLLVEAVISDIGLVKDGPVRIEVNRKGSVQKVLLDWHSFHQCLANLISNAVDAFAAGTEGTILIEVGHTDETVYFLVKDDGEGMSPQTIRKIKTGMYSTKGSKGTGLGLQVVQKIINEHEGVLTIESEEGEGSTFRIDLPARSSRTSMA